MDMAMAVFERMGMPVSVVMLVAVFLITMLVGVLMLVVMFVLMLMLVFVRSFTHGVFSPEIK